jgi:hypothetical protein
MTERRVKVPALNVQLQSLFYVAQVFQQRHLHSQIFLQQQQITMSNARQQNSLNAFKASHILS